MNFAVWLMTGGFLGGCWALYFAHDYYTASGDIIFSIIGALAFGLMASRYVEETPVADPNPRMYSPGGHGWAFLGAILLLAVFNIFLR